jgi:hypothetical protein
MSISATIRATNGAGSAQAFAGLPEVGDVTTLRDPTVMAELQRKVSGAEAEED